MSKSVDVILSAVKAAGEAAPRLHEENKALAAQLAAAERERDEMRELLWEARKKLRLYREAHSGEYIGGVEYTVLLARIDAAQLAAAAAERELAGMARNVRVRIPTDTMEQEFAQHYRRGYKAGKRDAERERDEMRELLRVIQPTSMIVTKGYKGDWWKKRDAALERQP